MIPCRVFLQSFSHNQQSSQKLKINLTLNSLFYDEIKPFQTKYLCLISTDVVGVEVVWQDSQKLVGQIVITNFHKKILESQPLEITIEPNPEHGLKKLKLVFLIEPVSSFSKKQLGISTKKLKIPPQIQQEPEPKNPNLQISFSQKEPLVESHLNESKRISPRSNWLNDTMKSVEELDSLESLAHQREKILGELFGRFKRDK